MPPPVLTVKTFATGLEQPTFLGSAPGDPERVYVSERATGHIVLFKNGVRMEEPFLDLSDRIGAAEQEQGLFGFAFHPRYPVNRYIFVNYTDMNGDTVVERFEINEDLDTANPGTGHPILAIEQPTPGHNGGMIAFGPLDHYLYIATGDGGPQGDPQDNAQRLDSPLGKILRIDVLSGTDVPYIIPPTNPFEGDPNALGEIWAYGLRNPWRFSFDRVTGDLYAGDVGWGSREEIDFQSAASGGGENYGWRVAEGFACRRGSGTCGTDPGFIPPIHDYAREIGRSVTGGYVYRGEAMPSLRGTYFFGDFVLGRVWSFRYDGSSLSEYTERTSELQPPGEDPLALITSFGEDARGEIYIVTYGGTIYKIVEAT